MDRSTAIVLGGFTRCPLPKDADFSLTDVLRDLFEPAGIPVVSTTAIGHGETNLAWKYGAPVAIRDGSLRWGSAISSIDR